MIPAIAPPLKPPDFALSSPTADVSDGPENPDTLGADTVMSLSLTPNCASSAARASASIPVPLPSCCSSCARPSNAPVRRFVLNVCVVFSRFVAMLCCVVLTESSIASPTCWDALWNADIRIELAFWNAPATPSISSSLPVDTVSPVSVLSSWAMRSSRVLSSLVLLPAVLFAVLFEKTICSSSALLLVRASEVSEVFSSRVCPVSAARMRARRCCRLSVRISKYSSYARRRS
mmetsp:Transcript_13026/g.32479  ORF Transcript_13026/g.32479 Transcript_13026/m.32479 type:complete len:233 (-) Transcript_13026:565-1263(-)